MRRTRWTAAAAAITAFALAAPAAAHDGAFGSAWWMGENHPGWYGPSPESQSNNVKMIGSVSRTRGRSVAEIMMTSSSPGNARKISPIRMMMLSTHPRK